MLCFSSRLLARLSPTAYLQAAVLIIALSAVGPGWSQSMNDGFSSPIILGEVREVRVDDHGKIMVGGSFVTGLWGQAKVMRMDPDGRRDSSFSVGFEPPNGQVESLTPIAGGGYLVGGSFTGSGYPSRLARLADSGSLIGSFDLDVNGTVRVIERTSDDPSTASYYIGGQFTEVDGQSRRRIARLNNNLEPDPSFNSPHFMGSVVSIAPQPDGKVLVAGTALIVDGQPGAGGIVFRLNANGSLDTSFVHTAIPTGLQSVVAMDVQKDGKIMIAGNFSATQGGQTRVNIARLESDGSLDPSFATASDANGTVRDLKLQPDGRIVVVGEFTNLGFLSSHIVRLHSDGSRDNGFDSFMMPDEPPNSVAIQGDGGVLIAGGFSEITGQTARRVARISKHLGLDQTLVGSGERAGHINAMAVERDGDLLIGGDFTMIQGQTRQRLARLSHGTGTLHGGFAPVVDGTVEAILAQPDGKILIAGDFQAVGGAFREGVARLNADGTLDNGFQPPSISGGTVYALEPGEDGKIYIGGEFDDIAGSGRRYFARLNADGSLDNSLEDLQLTGPVYAITHQWGMGRLYLGGDFSLPDSSAHLRVIRLFADGSVDTTFRGIVAGSDDSTRVTSLAATPDGGVLIGGSFTTILGAPPNFYSRKNFARLQSNGWPTSLDIGVAPSDPDHPHRPIRAVGVLMTCYDGEDRVFVGGGYGLGQGTPVWGLARFEPDGDMDLTLNFSPPIPGGYVHPIDTMLRFSDGKIAVDATIIDERDTLIRYSNGESIPDEQLSVDGSGTVTWSRRGKGPTLLGRPQLLLSDSCCDDEDFSPLPGYMSWDSGSSTWTYDSFPNLLGTYYLKVRSRIGDSNGSGVFETPIHQFYGGPEPPSQSDLSISVSADASEVADGDTVTMSIVVSNLGPDAATGVVAINNLVGFEYVEHSVDVGTFIPETGEWGIGSLSVGGAVELKLTVEANDSGAYSIKSDTGSSEFDPIPANNVDVVEIPQTPPPVLEADLAITLDATTGEVEPGDTVTFEVELSNLGPDPATEVFVFSVLVQGFTYAGHVANQGTYDPATGVWTVGNLAASGSASQATFKLDAVVNDEGPYMHLVQAHLNEHDPDAGNDQRLRFINVVFPIIDALFSDRFEQFPEPTQN